MADIFIKPRKRELRIPLKDWESNPKEYDNHVQDFFDRKGVKTNYGRVIEKTTYKTCTPCELCSFKGFIKETRHYRTE